MPTAFLFCQLVSYLTLRYVTCATFCCITLHYVAIQYNTIQYNTIQYNQCFCASMHPRASMHAYMHYITLLHYVALLCITSHYITLPYITSHYITLHAYIHLYVTHVRLQFKPPPCCFAQGSVPLLLARLAKTAAQTKHNRHHIQNIWSVEEKKTPLIPKCQRENEVRKLITLVALQNHQGKNGLLRLSPVHCIISPPPECRRRSDLTFP